MTCDYEEIYSRFYRLMTDSSFYKQDEDFAYNLMSGWIHDAISIPYIRKIFSSITLDDEMEELTFELENSIDEDSDKEFVLSVFAQQMVIQWQKPQIDNVINLANIIGGKEEKKIQSNYKSNIERLDSLEINLKKYIRDYGYEYNSYLSGGE